MKNLKKVLALVVVFSMMLSTVAFAAFPDVPEDADYANAVNTLAALGIISGDDQGNFNPENTVKRSEFTKIICEMQGLSGEASTGATAFTDVAADHWASGYINMATQLGIINGMGDGTFAPDSPVTYEQAIKMIVVALGYEPMAAEKGGYPTGYLYVAQSYGLTKGIVAPAQTDAAKRSLIAQLVYNALDLPMMEQVGFGSEKSFEVMDGSNDKARNTLLTTKFDVVKLGGVVIGNSKLAIDITLGDTDVSGSSVEDEITLAYDNNYKSTNEDFELVDRDDAGTVQANVGDTDAADYFGKRVTAYIQDEGRDYVVIAIVPEDAQSSVEIALADIDDANSDDAELAYFESDSARRSTKLDLAADIPVIWNNVTGYDIDDVYADLDTAARATLIDWDNDDVYDLIKVEEYIHAVVEEIDADILTLNMVDGDSLSLDDEDGDLDITIEDVDGNAVAFEDIAEGDVLAVISDTASLSYDEFIEVTVLGNTAVEGVVKAVDTNTAKTKVTIEGTVYTIDPNAYNKSKAETIGSEGIFYIGIDGQIVAFDGTKAAAGNYAIILQTEENDTGFDEGWQVKVLNKDGEAIIYNVADKVKIKNADGYSISYDIDDATESVDLAGTAWDAYDGQNVATILNAFDAEVEGDDYEEIINRTVQIKVNSSNEITEIAAAADDTFKYEGMGEYEFNASTNKFSIGKVDASTVIFAINNNDITKTKIITADALLDEATYTVAGFEKDNSVLTCAIILEGGNTLAGSVDGMAVVTGVSETRDANDNEAWAISFVENGDKEAKTILVTEDTEVDATYNDEDAMTLAEAMGIGSLFLYSADADGNATVIASIANIVDKAYVSALKGDLDDVYGSGSNATTFMYGVTTDRLTNDLATTAGEITVEGSTYKYRYNNANSRNIRIEVGNYKGGNVVTASDGEGNYVFARLVDGDVVDIISIDSRVAIPASTPSTPSTPDADEEVNYTVTFEATAGSNEYVEWAANAVVIVADQVGALDGEYTWTITTGETTYTETFTADAWTSVASHFDADAWDFAAGEYSVALTQGANTVCTGTFTIAAE